MATVETGFLDRSQSSTVGVILLVAVTVVVLIPIGLAVFSMTEPDPEPTVNVEITIEGETVVITHNGGHEFTESEELSILLEDNETSFIDASDADYPITPGDEARLDVDGGERLQLIWEDGSDAAVLETVQIPEDLESDTYSLTVELEDETGDPIEEDAEITVTDLEDGETVASEDDVTDASETFLLPEGDYEVTADADGYSEDSESVEDFDEPTTVTIDLESESGTLTGQVRRNPPLEDATVEFRQDDDVIEETATNESGYYVFEDVEPGEYTVSADRDDFRGNETTHKVEPGSVVTTPDVLLPMFATYEVRDVTVDDESVTPGEQTTIEATVENVGDLEDEQDIELRIDGEQIGAESPELKGGRTAVLTFEFEPSEEHAGDTGRELSAEVDSGNDTLEGSVVVRTTDPDLDSGGDIWADDDVDVDGSYVDGNVSATGDIDVDEGSVDGDVSADGDVDVDEGSVDGDVSADGDVDVDEGSVDGDVSADGDVDVDGGSVDGDVSADDTVDIDDGTVNGDVTADGDLTVDEGSVEGDIHSSDNIDIDEASVMGTVTACGDVEIDEGFVEGDVISGGEVDSDDATVGGDIEENQDIC